MSEKLGPVYQLKMQLALHVDKNTAAAIEASGKIVATVQHDSGPDSVNYLTKLTNHCNFRLD